MDLRLKQHRWNAIIYSRLLVAVHRYLRIVTPTYILEYNYHWQK